MRKLVPLLKRKGIPLQVIYNGSPDAGSDKAWVAQAVAHFRQYESILLRPSVAAFLSWDRYPTRNLPESDSSDNDEPHPAVRCRETDAPPIASVARGRL